MELLETWSKLYSLRFSPVRLLPFVFNAGIIFILLSLQATRNIRVGIQTLKKSLSQAELCVQYLHEMGQSWTAAASTARMLQGLIDSKLEPVIARRGLLVGNDQINSNPAPLAPDDAKAEALVPSDNPVPFTPSGDSTSWDWHEPQDMNAIMNELSWPQAWNFCNDPSGNPVALDELFGPTAFAPPMLFPGVDAHSSEVDMTQFLPPASQTWADSILESEH
ncbi:hypothetical protein C8J57DRAFT_212982 [Mycena rebaudengoi]|nr:hypothetical protein C8J57DRAFT_212982 [Mycena rebaudengoi]